MLFLFTIVPYISFFNIYNYNYSFAYKIILEFSNKSVLAKCLIELISFNIDFNLFLMDIEIEGEWDLGS